MFLIDVSPMENRTLQLTIADGFKQSSTWMKLLKAILAIFTKLQEDAYFRQVRVSFYFRTIVWANGADVCPDVLYSFASGQPILI